MIMLSGKNYYQYFPPNNLIKNISHPDYIKSSDPDLDDQVNIDLIIMNVIDSSEIMMPVIREKIKGKMLNDYKSV